MKPSSMIWVGYDQFLFWLFDETQLWYKNQLIFCIFHICASVYREFGYRDSVVAFQIQISIKFSQFVYPHFQNFHNQNWKQENFYEVNTHSHNFQRYFQFCRVEEFRSYKQEDQQFKGIESQDDHYITLNFFPSHLPQWNQYKFYELLSFIFRLNLQQIFSDNIQLFPFYLTGNSFDPVSHIFKVSFEYHLFSRHKLRLSSEKQWKKKPIAARKQFYSYQQEPTLQFHISLNIMQQFSKINLSLQLDQRNKKPC